MSRDAGMRIRITGPARRDIQKILYRSQAEFGVEARKRYQALLDQAFRDLKADATRLGVTSVEDIRAGYFLYHLKWSSAAATETVKKPRHLLVFYLDMTDVLVIARVFHERQLLSRHLADRSVD